MKDKVALITGGGSGIGKECVAKFIRNGAKVVICEKDEAKLDEVIKLSQISDGEIEGFAADISDSENVKKLFGFIENKFGRLDILVNNVGITRNGSITSMTDEDYHKVISTNLDSYFYCCREALKMMADNEYGRIINVSSRGWLGGMSQVNYAVSKGGIISLTRSLALEFARKGITVNCVAPGMIDTPLFWENYPELVEKRLEAQPMGRLGKPVEVANAIEFFAKEENSFITGQTLYVCGGASVLANCTS